MNHKENPQQSHRRFNPLTGEWVLISTGRLARPWAGLHDRQPASTRPHYDPGCYLCPGNERAGGAINPDYAASFVFTNDFPPLSRTPRQVVAAADSHTLFRAGEIQGTARVVCFSPDHDKTLALLTEVEIAGIVDVWATQVAELGARWQWVQVFENKGEIMGCSNPHPHGQIWAQSELPTEAGKEHQRQADYFQQHGSAMLLDYARLEIERGTRTVEINDEWLALVPYWAQWPFETLLLPLRQAGHIDDLDPRQRQCLAAILKRLLTRYDNLFECDFPYSMGWHGQPFDGGDQRHWQLHAHFYPPLLRSADVRKHMVGYEMLAEPQRDLSPEAAAAKLKSLNPISFRER